MRGDKNVQDRTEYQKEYYQRHKEQKKQNYNAQTQYLKWVEIKKLLNHSRRKISDDSYNYLMDELRKLDRYKC